MKTLKRYAHDFLTPAEIQYAVDLYAELARTDEMHKFAKRLDKELITPNINRINKALGQENDPRYIAYAVYYIINQSMQTKEGHG